MQVAAVFTDASPSMAERLEAILAELECEFHRLRRDIARSPQSRYAELMTVAEKIDFARYCVSCAGQVAHDRRVSIVLDG